MKKIIFLVLAVLGCNLHSHAQNCDSIARVEIIDKIKNYSPEDLLPYYDKDSRMWGYMTKEGKILTKPHIYNYTRYVGNIVFNPNTQDVFYDDCRMTIKGEDYSFVVEPIATLEMPVPLIEENLLSLKTRKKGFKIDLKRNRVTAIDPKYEIIGSPFLFQGKYYTIAILKENGKQGIIDQKGNILQNFDFNYKSLSLNPFYENKDKLWVYFKDDNGNAGFKNPEGKVKFLLPPLLSSPYSDYEQYSLQNNGKQSGIFDLENLEWIIEPQSEMNLLYMIHAGLDPEKQTVYIITKKEEDKYLIDLQGREYKPKK